MGLGKREREGRSAKGEVGRRKSSVSLIAKPLNREPE
jgi:hypothetical protein